MIVRLFCCKIIFLKRKKKYNLLSNLEFGFLSLSLFFFFWSHYVILNIQFRYWLILGIPYFALGMGGWAYLRRTMSPNFCVPLWKMNKAFFMDALCFLILTSAAGNVSEIPFLVLRTVMTLWLIYTLMDHVYILRLYIFLG